MYIVKNSYKSIVRAKGRNLLIFILVFLIAASPLALSLRSVLQRLLSGFVTIFKTIATCY